MLNLKVEWRGPKRQAKRADSLSCPPSETRLGGVSALSVFGAPWWSLCCRTPWPPWSTWRWTATTNTGGTTFSYQKARADIGEIGESGVEESCRCRKSQHLATKERYRRIRSGGVLLMSGWQENIGEDCKRPYNQHLATRKQGQIQEKLENQEWRSLVDVGLAGEHL